MRRFARWFSVTDLSFDLGRNERVLTVAPKLTAENIAISNETKTARETVEKRFITSVHPSPGYLHCKLPATQESPTPELPATPR